MWCTITYDISPGGSTCLYVFCVGFILWSTHVIFREDSICSIQQAIDASFENDKCSGNFALLIQSSSNATLTGYQNSSTLMTSDVNE